MPSIVAKINGRSVRGHGCQYPQEGNRHHSKDHNVGKVRRHGWLVVKGQIDPDSRPSEATHAEILGCFHFAGEQNPDFTPFERN